MLRTRRLAPLALVATISLLGACSSDERSGTSPTIDDTTADVGGATDAPTGITDAPAGGGGTPVLANGEAPPERTFTITGDEISPGSLAIGVGENVTFRGGDDGVYAIAVGPLDGVTVVRGLIETFEFPQAGTYVATEELSGATVTIVVG